MTAPSPGLPPDGAMQRDPDIIAEISERKISQIVHFTTNQGLLGIAVERLLQARARLDQDSYLESIYHKNALNRYEDRKYWRYVNLSISQANYRFLRISTEDWWSHTDLFWAVLSFDPAVMSHPGVLFATSNMGYQGIVPAADVTGLRSLFADRVPNGWGKTLSRNSGHTDDLTTSPQAEVLYPEALSTAYLQRISVMTENDAANAHAIVTTSGHDEVDVVVDPAAFGR